MTRTYLVTLRGVLAACRSDAWVSAARSWRSAPIAPPSAASSPTSRDRRCPARRSPCTTRTPASTPSASRTTPAPTTPRRWCWAAMWSPSDLEGFKKAVSSEILLQGGDAFRHDVTLQVGALSETVEVKSASGLSDTRPDVSHTVNEKYYRDLPIVTAGDVRLAESVLQMQPGYLPMKPNGDPMFRGSQFNSRINGGQTMATENFFDGAAFGYASGHQQSQESTPPVDAVQEVKVITTSYSAQYGHTSGGFIEYTAKSGTNAFHGSGYGYFADDAFNAKGFFAVGKTPLSNNDYGVHARRTRRDSEGLRRAQQDVLLHELRLHEAAVGRSPRIRQHDANRRVQGRRLQRAADDESDWHRRAGPADLMRARSSIPRRRALVNGVPVRDPYPGNVIPANDPLRSARRGEDCRADGPARSARARRSTSPATRPATRRGSSNARNILVRADHSFSPNFRISDSFYWNRRPSIPQLRRRRRLHHGVLGRDRPRRRTTPTSARGSISASPRITRTSSSTGSSATTW